MQRETGSGIARFFTAAALVTLLQAAGTAESNPIRGKIPLFEGWTVSSNPESPDKIQYVEPNDRIHIQNREGYFTLSREFSLPAVSHDAKIWLFMSKFPAPCRVYLNGSLIGTRGTMPPEYFVNIGTPFTVALPPGLLLPDKPNRLEIRANYRGPSLVMTECYLADEDAWRFETGISELFNARIYVVFAAIAVFAWTFFLLQYFFRRKEKSNLVYAMACLFMGISFLEIGTPTAILPTWLLRPLGKASLIAGLAFLVDFYIVFFKILDKPAIRFPLYAAAAAIIIPVCFTSNETMLMNVFGWSVWLMLAQLLLIIFIVVSAIVKKRDYAIPIGMGTGLGICFSLHDIAYRVAGVEPFAWMQGVGFFVLMCSIFFSLASRSSKAMISLEASALELEAKERELSEANESIARFIPRELLDVLGKKSVRDIHLGDHAAADMAILFADIRGFTLLSENMSSEENFSFLNGYFRVMVPHIRKEGGIVTKYLGDVIVALFPSGPLAAMNAAVSMGLQLKAYNAMREVKRKSPTEVGMAIHSGRVTIGMIGERHRMDATLVSDAVSVASRLVQQAKTNQVPLVVSESAMKILKKNERFAFRPMGVLPSKGDAAGIPYYEAAVAVTEPLEFQGVSADTIMKDFARGI